MRLLNLPPKTLEERYFTEIRPLLYERHGTHYQWGTRDKHTLAEHLDSACQFALTVSRMAGVPDDKRAVILAATAIHDLNKLDELGRKVKTLARSKELQEQLEKAGVSSFVAGDADLELVRRLVERHSGHHQTDGTLFLPEDPSIDRWASILRAADLFDLQLAEQDLTRKVRTELTHALKRPSDLYRVRISEDRGYMTALLLAACEEILIQYKLTPLAIFPDGELFEGETFPDVDLIPKIAARLQSMINEVFGNNIEQLVKPGNNGIRILPQAVQQDLQEVVQVFLYYVEKKKAGYKVEKVQVDINKHILGKVDSAVIEAANAVGLRPVSNAEEFALSEALKGVFASYRKVKPEISVDQAWDKIAAHVGLTEQQRQALHPFDEQYGRSLLAATGVTKGIEGIQAALMESLEMRRGSTTSESEDIEVDEELVGFVARTINLPNAGHLKGFSELDAYIEANPKKRCSLGSTVNETEELSSAAMPIGTKVQVFSNRLPGGLIAEPKRQAEPMTLLAYQLLSIGANFPKKQKEPPYYLHLALPEGSCPELLRIWRECLRNLAAKNAEGAVSVDVVKLYRDNAIDFQASKGEGFAFPKRPEFVHNTVLLPMVWGEANTSVALLKSLRLALELSLSFDLGFPFVLSSSLQIEPSVEFYGRVEGIPTAFSRLLGSGRYSRGEAETVRDRLRCLGNLVQAVASIRHFDDCLYDLARATTQPFSLYYVLLRWLLREQAETMLESTWLKIRVPLNHLLESLMPTENTKLTLYLKQAAQLAVEANLRGSSFNRTSITKPFTDFLKDVRSCKGYADLDFLFAALSQKFHNHLDRIWDYKVGETKLNQITQYYNILRRLYEEVYNARPEKLLSDRENLTAAYLFFWQEAFQTMKAKKEAEAAKLKSAQISESTQTTI